jgi:predicted dehydrogenase
MDKVRIGIIGCGGMARHHGRLFTKYVPDAEIVALAEPSEANLARFIKEVFEDDPQAEPATFGDYRTMLEQIELDGVLIVSPHDQHFQQAVDVMDAGAHVLVEKPMVIRTEDALALIQHADARGKVVSVAFPGPFSTEFQYVREVRERGELGEISLLSGHCCQQWIQNVAGSWRTDPVQSGGGNLYDSGAHMFNGMLYLSGLAVTEVFAMVNNKDQQVDIEAAVALRFSNGALGTATVSGDATYFEQGIYLQGTTGTIKASIYGGSVEHYDRGQRVKYPRVPDVSLLQQNFVDVVRGRAETPSPALLGLRQARLMDAIYESARTGKPVSVVADGA